jgi:DNA-directed RNA polymerase specialized sigma24 family protein
MTVREIKRYLPLVKANYAQVLDILEERAKSSPHTKADRQLLLETYLRTRNHRLTAERCGIGVNRVNQLLAAAIRCAREITGVPPPGPRRRRR